MNWTESPRFVVAFVARLGSSESVPDSDPVLVVTLAVVWVVVIGDISGANTGVARVLDSIGGDSIVK